MIPTQPCRADETGRRLCLRMLAVGDLQGAPISSFAQSKANYPRFSRKNADCGIRANPIKANCTDGGRTTEDRRRRAEVLSLDELRATSHASWRQTKPIPVASGRWGGSLEGWAKAP